jgi:putative ABC transport system ATP-binding protein
MVMTIVDAHNIIKTFGSGGKKTTILHDISLQIAEHEFIAIMGPSGSGKSTLVKILGLLDRAQKGDIKLYGSPLPKSDKALSKLRNETIGFVFQDYRLIPHYSALDNVAVPLKIAGKGRGYQKKRAAELLRLVGLGEVLDQKAGQLSGGQQQRVGIARALAMQPKLLIADEPTGNLDSVTGATIMKILRTIHAKLGTTIIIVTHSPDVAAQANRIITIRDGKIARGAA